MSCVLRLVLVVVTVFISVSGERNLPRRLYFQKFLKHQEINRYLNNMADNYPNRVSVKKIGVSSEGRDLEVIQISSNAGRSIRPSVFILGGVHASEWITPALGLYITQELLQNRTNKDLVDSVDWYILPLFNPDGYEYSHSQDRQWMKSRSKKGDSSCVGVALERNFGLHWNGSNTDPCSTEYPGETPFSEPEVRAVRDFVLENKDRIKLYLELQCFGSNIAYPWGYTTEPPEDVKTLEAVANIANEALIAGGDYRYTIGNYAKLLSPAYGTAMDWMKGEAEVPLSYTVKITNPPGRHAIPEKFIKSTISKFFPAVRAFGTYVKEHF